MKRFAISVIASEKEVSPSLNLCEYYFLIDYKNNKIENILKVRNPFKKEEEASKLVNFIKDQQTNTLVTGKLSYKTINLLKNNGIDVFDNYLGEINKVIHNYISMN